MSVLIHVQHISTVRVHVDVCGLCVARVVPVLRSVDTGSQRLCYSHYRNICALVRSRSNSCESICPRAPGSLVPARPDDDRLRNTVFRATRPAGRIKKSIASCLPARWEFCWSSQELSTRTTSQSCSMARCSTSSALCFVRWRAINMNYFVTSVQKSCRCGIIRMWGGRTSQILAKEQSDGYQDL